jgi:hypothetical protein
MTKRGAAILKSAIRVQVARHALEGAELIGAFLDLAVEHHADAGLDAHDLRFELDKKLLEAAVATMAAGAN